MVQTSGTLQTPPPAIHKERAQSWFMRYKLYHIPFWMTYQYLWWTLRIGSPLEVANAIFLNPAATCKYVFYVAFQALGVYFNLYFLMPRLLDRNRYVAYVVSVVLTIILCAWCIVGGYYVGALLSDKTFQELYSRSPYDVYGLFESGSLPSTAAAMTLAMSIKLTKRWVEGRRRLQLMEQEKLETELKFLKSQFNPHFLFNTINSIFVLINKDPRSASDALARFSDLLRYQLYECNEHEITLSQELAYLENFIALQKIRQDDNVEVSYETITPQPDRWMVAPFMLMPFAENAFKHVSRSRHQRNYISISLTLANETLRLVVINTIGDTSSRDISNAGGIGMKNVTRRLALLYPDAHRLDINRDPQMYRIDLALQLRAAPGYNRVSNNTSLTTHASA
ncbi:histidine kinase [Chryseolinea sp. T2]|uniref:sensor histidine kinase n=1 Tax=Chryseolinea sp. T2 TaxID=3129255 RepID=UPI00307890A5